MPSNAMQMFKTPAPQVRPNLFPSPLPITRLKCIHSLSMSTPTTLSLHPHPPQPWALPRSLIQELRPPVAITCNRRPYSSQHPFYFAPHSPLIRDYAWSIRHRDNDRDVGQRDYETRGFEQAVAVEADVLYRLSVSFF